MELGGADLLEGLVTRAVSSSSAMKDDELMEELGDSYELDEYISNTDSTDVEGVRPPPDCSHAVCSQSPLPDWYSQRSLSRAASNFKLGVGLTPPALVDRRMDIWSGLRNSVVVAFSSCVERRYSISLPGKWSDCHCETTCGIAVLIADDCEFIEHELFKTPRSSSLSRIQGHVFIITQANE